MSATRKCSDVLLMIVVLWIMQFMPSAFMTGASADDIELLKVLRSSLVKSSDAIPGWFDSDFSPCNWTGIDCYAGRVTAIDLPCLHRPLSLPFPGCIGQFRSLERLNLSRCDLNGSISADFWSLENLEVLDLTGNRLTGMLPLAISTLQKLRVLVLDENDFSGSLPSTIGELKELRELSLHANSFSGKLPEEIGDLGKLQALDLSTNMFSGNLPSSLGNLTEILHFSARLNRFTGTIFPEIGNLRKLITLNLAWNKLSGPIPGTIGNLQKLMFLDLQECSFTGKIPEEISGLSSLTKFSFGYNEFEGELPSGIGRLLNLVYLFAPKSGLTGRIPSELGNCTRLKIIDLSYNSFFGPLPTSLARMESLYSLELDENQISGPFPVWISNWTRVQSIMLSNNLLSGTFPPPNLPQISFLDLTGNALSGDLPAEICKNAKTLSSLKLSGNNFTGTIEGIFENCLSLKVLDLSKNGLSGELPVYLGELQLVTLDFSKNKISGMVPDQIWELKTLMEISLSDNMLKGQLSDKVSPRLRRLHLDNNLFEGGIPSIIGNLKNLTNLSVCGNKLTGEIPLELFECKKLVTLDLSANTFSGLIPKSISQLKNLVTLVLSNNQFSGSIPDELCEGFRNMPLPDSEFLQHYGMIDLSNNEFTGSIPTSIERCIILRELLLQRNKLTGNIPLEISGLEFLSNLDLSSNYLTGPVIPQLFSMTNLQGLNLSHNRIHGSVPEDLGTIKMSLVVLDISNNWMTGPLPSTVFSIESLTHLDVSTNSFSGPLSFGTRFSSSLLFLNASNNKFSGALDSSVSNLTSLSSLDLHNNTITSTLPPSLSSLAELTYVDISENELQGPFPCNICNIIGLTFTNFSTNKFSGEVPGNCSASVLYCSLQAEVSPVVFHTRGKCVTSLPLTCPSVVGIAISASLFSLALLIGILTRKILKQEAVLIDTCTESNTKPGKTTDHHNSCTDNQLLMKKMKDPLSINVATFEHTLLRLKHTVILSATENFSSSYIIGNGGFGIVYRGKLPGGRVVAVKRLYGGHEMPADREFFAEMETLGKVKHENLVPLLGYCSFGEERFLIYEYMENGSLESWLRNRADAAEPLSWPTRLAICLGSARGIAFLHHGFVPHIIHRDIKSSNILLDENFEPRVSDFGLARIISACESHVSTVLAGTFGYIPPEYGQAMAATAKGDVYSFGVVVLELVTGRAPTGQADGEGGNLVGWVRWMVAKGKEGEVLDPCFSGTYWDSSKDQMLRVLRIAQSCTCDEPWNRPTMLQVVKLLKEAAKMK